MYTTCLFCSAALGTNETIEHFPVGGRLAFDGDTGRLWVVCRRCERWNLTPLEERWEAIEECERLFRGTRLRTSTDHVGLARLREGLDLVRIGSPLRPEIAAWRYGDQFGRRRKRRMIGVGAVAAVGSVAIAGSVAAGFGMVAALQLGRLLWQVTTHGNPRRHVARIRDARGTLYRLRRSDILRSKLMLGTDGELGLRVAYDSARDEPGYLRLEGLVARQAAAQLLPVVNRMGGTKDEVQHAVGRIERAGTAEQFLRDTARRGEKLTRVVPYAEASGYSNTQEVAWQSGLYALSTTASLALEMALHEEQERRAVEGELAELEQAWRDAEELGAIADSLLLPAGIDATLDRLRRKTRSGETPS